MKKVLWVSSFPLPEEDKIGLERKFGEIEVKHFDKPITNSQQIKDAGEDCDILCLDFYFPRQILVELASCTCQKCVIVRQASVLQMLMGDFEAIYQATLTA